MSPLSLLLILLLHLTFLASVFDIYFKSTVLTGISQTHSAAAAGYDAPARRLILIVADGLRADTFFTSTRTPFLHEMAREHGTWGVSHTRVPTESRPGHVAMIAGMYEDPSAITKGWSQNPVQFDTLFNQTRKTWAWGSPDILPMFEKGVVDGRVSADYYSHEMEDLFGQKDLSMLDTWVFDKVDELFASARDPSSPVRAELREDRIVLFLHLLGLDSNGHVHKPGSPELDANLEVVDEGVRRVVRAAEEHWRGDDRTAFVFTADHGMTDWGSHGAGMAHETEVPLVAWGAGIHHPETRSEDAAGLTWRRGHRASKKHRQRLDVGSSRQGRRRAGRHRSPHGFPHRNSEGLLPHPYLRLPASHKVSASLSVARQVNQMVLTQGDRFAPYVHSPYPGLGQKEFNDTVDRINRLANMGKATEALELSDELARSSLEANSYYQKYYRTQLFVTVSLSYVGFLTWTVLNILANFSPLVLKERDFDNNNKRRRSSVLANAATAFSLLGSAWATAMQNVPAHYFVYYATPVVLWRMVYEQAKGIRFSPGSLSSSSSFVLRNLVNLLFALAVSESTVAAFFDRRVLSAAVPAVALWQLARTSRCPAWLRLAYAALSLCLCAFTFQPTIGKDHNSLLVLAGGLISSIAALLLLRSRPQLGSGWATRLLVLYQPLSGLLVHLSLAQSLGEWTQSAVRAASWIVFVSGVPVALAGSRPSTYSRLLHLCLALQSSYSLLSLSYESLFLFCLGSTMAAWLEMERREEGRGKNGELLMALTDRPKNVVSWSDVFRSLLFVFYSVVSFFGTGNIASVNSFDPRSIQCLVSVFAPFLMGGLLLSKVLIPFLQVSLFSYLVRSAARVPRGAFPLLILLASDLTSLHFFFLVTDAGSWLDIGASLSRFVIAEAMVIFLSALLWAAGKLIGEESGEDEERRD